MARLLTLGFEAQQYSTASTTYDGADPLYVSNSGGGNPTWSTSVLRTGAPTGSVSLSIPAGTVVGLQHTVGTANTTRYLRFYYRKSSSFSVNGSVIATISQTTANVQLLIDSNDSAYLYLSNGTKSSTATISNSIWHRIEIVLTQQSSGNGTASFYLNGVFVGQIIGDIGTIMAANGITIAGKESGGSGTVNIDDVAMNDSTGTANNGLPGDGRVVMLKPISDNARVGYVLGLTGTTPNTLYTGVDNTPPIGVANSDALNTNANARQIRSTNNNTTDYFRPNMTSYSTAGITTADKINVLQAVAQIGNSGTTALSQGLQVISNPAVSESTGSGPNAAAGNTPSNWRRLSAAISENPTGITLATSPVTQIRKNTGSANAAMCDFMAIVVDYSPVTIGIASETDSASSVSSKKIFNLGTTTETDTAKHVTTPKFIFLGVVNQINSASSLANKIKLKTLTLPEIKNTAEKLIRGRLLGTVLEEVVAKALSIFKLNERDSFRTKAVIGEQTDTAVNVEYQLLTAQIDENVNLTGIVNENIAATGKVDEAEYPQAKIEENY